MCFKVYTVKIYIINIKYLPDSGITMPGKHFSKS